jgi:hypothetical protein
MNRRTFLKLSGAGLLSTAATIASGAEAQAAQPRAATPVICVQACASSVNVRTGASIRAARVGRVYLGQNLNVAAISADRAWWCVYWGRGTAWISADPAHTTPIAWRR